MRRDFPLNVRIADHAAGYAAAWSAGSPPEPVRPRPASTVVLLREGGTGLEAFMMLRTATMKFAAEMYVFPGGGVDPRDGERSVSWAGPEVARWAHRLGVDHATAAGFVAAAVRELFEECGVLLAGPAGGDVVADLSDPSWEADRLALIDRSLALSELLARRGLQLRTDLLHAWSHWCTPVFEPRRYDTWFFVAELPPGQLARDLGGEAVQARWMPVAQAAGGGADGSLAMMSPTVVTLEEIGAAADLAALRAQPRRPRLLVPWLADTAQGLTVRVDLDGAGGGHPGPADGIEADARTGREPGGPPGSRR